jgi:tRNA (Thr-GGU) A37 N-methylase
LDAIADRSCASWRSLRSRAIAWSVPTSARPRRRPQSRAVNSGRSLARPLPMGLSTVRIETVRA